MLDGEPWPAQASDTEVKTTQIEGIRAFALQINVPRLPNNLVKRYERDTLLPLQTQSLACQKAGTNRTIP